MRDQKRDFSSSRIAYRVATTPVVGYTLILLWQKGVLPKPRGEATARLKDGRRLQCLLADKTQRTMYLGLFEPDETRLLADLLGPGDSCIDVGAHIGWFTTLAAGLVGASGQVVACEPYPSNLILLQKNLDQNGCRNVRLVATALGSRLGTLSLAAGAGDSGAVTALDWAHDGRVEVPMTTLDDISGDLGDIALIKMDVEGWEAQILAGAEETLARTRHVLIEINRPALKKAGSSEEDLFDLLRRAGFTRFHPVTPGGLRRFQRSVVGNVLATRSK
jgi:FkbM family methyltransferase